MSYEFRQPISKEIFEIKYNLYDEPDVETVVLGISKEIASAEKNEIRRKEWKKKFYDKIISGELIPAGRILANARPFSKMKNYNNCFTIDIKDSMEGIYESLKEDALISKMGGGVGFDISKIRPKDAPLSKGGESSGPISFLKVFNESAKVIHTGGHRRSAHIALLDVSHPDIEEFITVKQGDTNGELTQFNISVKISDAFMKAVEKDNDWDLVFGGEVYKTVKAKYIYDLIAENAFMHNEPGVFYSDNIEYYNNGWWAFKLDRVNPCGEIVMPSYSLCCLSAINLAMFVKYPFTDEAYFDFEEYKETVGIGVRFLDNVLDKTAYPLKKIEDFSQQWRRIGLGITGLGDALAMMKVAYGSKKGKEITEQIAYAHMIDSYQTSIDLAIEKGAFPACDNEKLIKSNFIKEKLPKQMQKEIKKHGMRNIALNTIAPTGTTSFSMGQNCSSGVEPIFSLSYERNIRTGRADETTMEIVSDYAWLLYKEKFGENAKVPDYFVTTLNIDAYDSIDMQAIWQKYIDHSISKTLNLPENTKKEDYKRLFEYAYSKGLKGFTTFNPYGSMKGILEYSKEKKKDEQVDDEGRPITVHRVEAPKRPKDLECDIHQITVNKEKHIVLVGRLNDGSIYEVFVTPNPDKEIDLGSYKYGIIRKIKKGQYQLIVPNGEEKCIVDNIGKQFNETYASLSRFISMGLRHGVDLQFIITQLQKDTSFSSFEKAVARILKKYIEEGEKVIVSGNCPICESTNLLYKDGCPTCADCGWSKCD